MILDCSPYTVARAFEPLTREWVLEKFGSRLCDGILKENENDVLAGFDAQTIVDHWEEIRGIIAATPMCRVLNFA